MDHTLALLLWMQSQLAIWEQRLHIIIFFVSRIFSAYKDLYIIAYIKKFYEKCIVLFFHGVVGMACLHGWPEFVTPFYFCEG